jgi:hypothetical protein
MTARIDIRIGQINQIFELDVITCQWTPGLAGGDRRSFESGAGPFSAPFGFVDMLPFQVLPQEEVATGEHQDESLLPGFH